MYVDSDYTTDTDTDTCRSRAGYLLYLNKNIISYRSTLERGKDKDVVSSVTYCNIIICHNNIYTYNIQQYYTHIVIMQNINIVTYSRIIDPPVLYRYPYCYFIDYIDTNPIHLPERIYYIPAMNS
jgi:hypothetical protein